MILTKKRLLELLDETFPAPSPSMKTKVLTPEQFNDWLEYFSHFVDPAQGCICCGDSTVNFVWGYSNGEGQCATCGYPVRVYHRPEIAGVKQETWVRVLQYQPKDLSCEEQDESE
jgi:hypothetical protein